MSRDSTSILDVAKAGRQVLQFAEGLSREQLETDLMRQSAILYQIPVIGEATKRLSPSYREQYPDIPWKQMAGMRDFLAHQYDRIDFDTVWEVIQQEIPELLKMIAPLLPEQ
jgi:uncharacterized protein with HEPN domain